MNYDNMQVFSVSTAEMLAAVHELGIRRRNVSDAALELLYAAGLADKDVTLSETGEALYRTAWILKDGVSARKMLGQAVRATLPIQVMDQELRNFGQVPDDGVLNLLKHHGVVPPDFTIDAARRGFRWLNECGVIAFSSKYKTVRFIPDDVEAAKPGETSDFAAMISPRTPYSNVARLRRVLRQLTGIVTWADPHFGARAFEELIDELDASKVSEFHILSGDAENVLTTKSFKDLQRFIEEMLLKSVAVEWRIDPARDWHDRFLVHDGGAFNMPPVNNLFQNQYSEILPSSEIPPVEEWWNRSTRRTV